MPFNILILPLLGGFVFITRWNRTRWHALRADKERLLFYASLAGLAHLSLVFICYSLFSWLLPCVDDLPCIPRMWARHVEFPYSGLSVAAFLSGAASWKLLNRWWKNEDESDRVIRDEGGPFEKLFDNAMQNRKRVIISMKGGKVYVGRVGASYTPGQRDQTILILPSKSGYREKDNQRVIIMHNYDDTYDRIRSDHPNTYTEIIQDFGIVIPVSEIVGITLYNDLVYTKYFASSAEKRIISN